MPLNVIIHEHQFLGGRLSPTSSNSQAILNAIVGGWIKAGTTVTPTGALIDSFQGFDIHIAGEGLAVHSLGNQLGSGTIRAINVLSPGGALLASLGTATAGGLSLDVKELQAAFCDAQRLDALVAYWNINYSAAGAIPAGTDPAEAGVAFEGARGADSITGSLASDLLRGAAGNDTIWGQSGNDDIQGDHTQFLQDEPVWGDDVLYGGDGQDVVRGQVGNDRIHGGNGDDQLFGDDEDGVAGDDSLWGNDGKDVFRTEGGSDAYFGGAGRDRIVLQDRMGSQQASVDLVEGKVRGYGTDIISSVEIVEGARLTANVLSGSTAANGLTGGWIEDTLSGRDGNDRLWGDRGDDALSGGGGNDLLSGGSGQDTLEGGAGIDAFLFTDRVGDEITDFASVDDVLWLSKGLMPTGTALGTLGGAFFKDLSLGKVDATDRVVYDRAEGLLFLDANGSAAGGRTLLARLDPGTLLVAGDIRVVEPLDRDYFLL